MFNGVVNTQQYAEYNQIIIKTIYTQGLYAILFNTLLQLQKFKTYLNFIPILYNVTFHENCKLYIN